jgi:hypothetical protein
LHLGIGGKNKQMLRIVTFYVKIPKL